MAYQCTESLTMSSCIHPGPHSLKMSEEHYLPAGLGELRNCKALLDKVCESCNNKIGNEIDAQFLRTGPVGLFRWIVGLRGRKGSSPSPVALGRIAERF